MHKDEASLGFKILSNPDNVKICKMLYVNNSLTYNELDDIMSIDLNLLDESLLQLEKANFIKKDNYIYYINKEYVDELLDFIKTPCGCHKK